MSGLACGFRHNLGNDFLKVTNENRDISTILLVLMFSSKWSEGQARVLVGSRRNDLSQMTWNFRTLVLFV